MGEWNYSPQKRKMKRGEGVWGSAEKLWKFYRQRAEINEMKQAEHSSKEKRTLTNYQAGSFSQQQQRWRSDCRPAFNATVFLATSHFLPARPRGFPRRSLRCCCIWPCSVYRNESEIKMAQEINGLRGRKVEVKWAKKNKRISYLFAGDLWSTKDTLK